jgi:hypothetical protein
VTPVPPDSFHHGLHPKPNPKSFVHYSQEVLLNITLKYNPRIVCCHKVRKYLASQERSSLIPEQENTAINPACSEEQILLIIRSLKYEKM